jgi:Flp pilus assembly protein TadG
MPRPTPASRSAASAADGCSERGAGLISTVAGVTVFLAFLLLAVQLLTNLYAASAVTAAAYDAARVVAGADGGQDARSRAETHARAVLGRYAERVSFSWMVDDDVVRLRVTARNPRFLLPRLGGAVGFDTVDRTVRVRVERLR